MTENKKDIDKKQEEGKYSLILELIEAVAISYFVLMLIYYVVAIPEIVSGASMEPTLYTNERILVDKVTPHFKPYKRGDIVVLHPPSNDNIDYVKRIIGLPGEIIKILNCKVYISKDGNQFVLVEDYLYDNMCTLGGTTIVEGKSQRISGDSYVVLGDNRTRSADSRIIGQITSDRIIGKVVLRFWPLNKLTFL